MSRWKSNFESQQISQLIQQSLNALEGMKIEGMSQSAF
jgi:hypothetical protein